MLGAWFRHIKSNGVSNENRMYEDVFQKIMWDFKENTYTINTIDKR